MKVDFSVKEHELLVRLKLIERSIKRVLLYVDKGVLEIPENLRGYSLITDLNDIDELCDRNQNYFQMWKETEVVTMEVMKQMIKDGDGGNDTTHIYTDLCTNCDEVVQYTDVFSCCPNCLTSF